LIGVLRLDGERRRELLRQARERSTSPFHDFRPSRGVTWLEPTLTVEVTL